MTALSEHDSSNPVAYRVADAWPYWLGAPEVSGVIKTTPEDFVVEEILGFEPDGSGEHLWLLIEKISLTTATAQQLLARVYNVPRREVTYSGMKDKHAVTRQWFCIRVGVKVPPELPTDLPIGLRCLRAAKNSRKLRRGVHRGNRFVLVLRNLQGDPAQLQTRLAGLQQRGAPNYFGPQRFGTSGENVQALMFWIQGGRAPRDRDTKSILLSAGRSFLFNTVLAQRVLDNTWDQVLEGDCFALAGSVSTFRYSGGSPESLTQRILSWDIHPTGPLWGKGDTCVSAAALALESEVTARYPELAAGLLNLGLAMERRALRMAVQDLKYQIDGQMLTLEFALDRGCYATAVLRELLQVQDAQERRVVVVETP